MALPDQESMYTVESEIYYFRLHKWDWIHSKSNIFHPEVFATYL